MVSITPPTSTEPPDLKGFDVSDSAWQLDLTTYQSFIREITGESPTGTLSGSDCYRIGNLIEGFIEEQIRIDEWHDRYIREYPDVNSREEVLWLARYFRKCHECCIGG